MDRFGRHRKTLDSVCDQAHVVTPSDTEDLVDVCRSLYVGTGGDLVCTLANDASPVTFKDVPSGSWLPIRIRRVHAAGTTAANLVALT